LLLGARAPLLARAENDTSQMPGKSYETKSSHCALSAGEGARAPSKAEARFRN